MQGRFQPEPRVRFQEHPQIWGYDFPIHFSANGWSADEIPLDMWIVALAVMDIYRKAEKNPDARVNVVALQRRERRHVRIPRGACLAMRIDATASRKGTSGQKELHPPVFGIWGMFLPGKGGINGRTNLRIYVKFPR